MKQKKPMQEKKSCTMERKRGRTNFISAIFFINIVLVYTRRNKAHLFGKYKGKNKTTYKVVNSLFLLVCICIKVSEWGCCIYIHIGLSLNRA